MILQCPNCRVRREANKDVHRLLRTVVSDGREWILITCRDCNSSFSIGKFHAFYEGLSKLAGVTHISKPRTEAI